MRRGLDFAWSRPGVAAIAAGGFTFVCRYLSYDTTGKNLTRKEADTYRSHGIDVVSNWEYAANAALSGRGQGQRDATAAQGQHLACGGDPAAPVYFSVDFDAGPGQQGAIDEYLRGAASVIGVARVGVYGGFYVVKRCLDNGTARWGWQTYAWSGGRWDPRAAIRQVQNGVQVSGADCDINTTDLANFGQWFATGADPSPGPLPGPPAPPPEDPDMPKLLRVAQTGMILVTNGTTWYHLETQELVDAARVIWGLGEPSDIGQQHLAACGTQVPWPSAGGGGAPVTIDAAAVATALVALPAFKALLVEAARAGANLAEDS